MNPPRCSPFFHLLTFKFDPRVNRPRTRLRPLFSQPPLHDFFSLNISSSNQISNHNTTNKQQPKWQQSHPPSPKEPAAPHLPLAEVPSLTVEVVLVRSFSFSSPPLIPRTTNPLQPPSSPLSLFFHLVTFPSRPPSSSSPHGLANLH